MCSMAVTTACCNIRHWAYVLYAVVTQQTCNSKINHFDGGIFQYYPIAVISHVAVTKIVVYNLSSFFRHAVAIISNTVKLLQYVSTTTVTCAFIQMHTTNLGYPDVVHEVGVGSVERKYFTSLNIQTSCYVILLHVVVECCQQHFNLANITYCSRQLIYNDIQSVPSVVGKESCNKMALKRCTSTEMRWYIIIFIIIIINKVLIKVTLNEVVMLYSQSTTDLLLLLLLLLLKDLYSALGRIKHESER